MNQIQPFPLWVGHAGDGSDFRRLCDVGIKALVLVAEEEPPAPVPRDMICCRFPLVDGPGNEPEVLYLALQTLVTLLQRRVPTLVCCSGGVSRAPALTAAALALVGAQTPAECLERVVQHHPSDVTPGFWNEVTAVLASFR